MPHPDPLTLPLREELGARGENFGTIAEQCTKILEATNFKGNPGITTTQVRTWLIRYHLNGQTPVFTKSQLVVLVTREILKQPALWADLITVE